MTTVPEFLPVISKGAHEDPSDGACVMEYVSMIAGEKWSDQPSCTHPVLAMAARFVNDKLSDAERYRMVPFIGRLFGTGDTFDKQLSVDLANWSAARAANAAANAAVYAARAARAANAAANTAAGYAAADAADAADYAINYAANAADAAKATSYAVNAVDYAVNAVDYAAKAANYAANAADYADNTADYAAKAANATSYAVDALLQFFSDLLDEYDRLTGRVSVPDITSELVKAAEKVG
jgi:hypothetical protein